MYSEYRTPKRRHSSLFQRMQEQIEKISRKLSQAKGSTRQSTFENIKSSFRDGKIYSRERQKQEKSNEKIHENIFNMTNHKHKRKNIHFQQFPQPSVVETVRIKRKHQNEVQLSPYSEKKTIPSRTLNRRLNFVPLLRENQQDRIFQLEQQNQVLTMQLKKLQSVCIDQSHRLGYASAYFDDKCKKLQHEKEEYLKENIYLKKLCEHYKSKSKKYKDNLRKYSNKKVSESSCQYLNG